MFKRVNVSWVAIMGWLLLMSAADLLADTQDSEKLLALESSPPYSTENILQRMTFLYKEAYKLAQCSLDRPSINQLTNPGIPSTDRSIPGRVWCMKSGDTLKSVLISWTQTASWSLKWQAEHDYPILADICFTGGFKRAMEQVIEAYREAEYPLYLDIYPNQHLAVITH